MTRLFETMAEACTRLVPTTAPDGEGGTSSAWAEGAQFLAAVTLSQSSEGTDAGRAEAADSYQVTGTEALAFGDVFRRERDGRCFRVTSYAADMTAPACATFALSQVRAEDWRLPDAD